MQDLVTLHNKQAVTTSLVLAEAFEKKHKHVLDAISSKISTAENSALYKNMFAEATYTASNGKQNKMYYMNRDGFTFIAMGFTGKKADEFKLKYIEAFNQMERQITHKQDSYAIDDPVERAERWIEEQKQYQIKLNRMSKQLEIDKPKTEYFDRCMKSKGLTTTTKIAKEYGMTGIKLNQFLNDKKIIYKRGNKWYVFQKYSNDNLTGYDMRVDKKGYHNTLKWTPKGEKFVKDLLEDEGKLPVSEQPNQMIIEEPKVEYDGKYYTASEIAWRMHLSNEWVRKIGRVANDLHLKPVYTDENKYCRRVTDQYGRESYEYTRYGARILEEYINNEIRQEILDYINEKNRLNK